VSIKDEKLVSISQASWFFDVSTQWLRWRERQGILARESGEPILPLRKSGSKKGGGDRMYSLVDIREIAHALRRAEILDNENLKKVLSRVDAFEVPVERG
jgi:hypothetical protein